MSANSPCLRAHDLIDKLAMSPSTYKRRTAPQKVASSKKKAEPPKKVAMPPARREEPQQATCEYSESCFICYIIEQGYFPTKHLQNRYQRPLRER